MFFLQVTFSYEFTVAPCRQLIIKSILLVSKRHITYIYHSSCVLLNSSLNNGFVHFFLKLLFA